MNILVTGGAGYIGSHTAHQLVEKGHKVVVLDNLYSGFTWAIPPNASFVHGNAGDTELVRNLLKSYEVDAVLHFAAHIEVGESVLDPLKYYQNNLSNSVNLIREVIRAKVRHFVFSSTAAVYGDPTVIPVDEDFEKKPINPYGHSKLLVENILESTANSYNNFNYVALRYFNVAGARLDLRIGQATPNATHLVKIAAQAACGLRDKVIIYGSDYNTPDGTCLRDYIHVEDLARAHIDALNFLETKGTSISLNCGYGHGYSVQEVINAMKNASGVDFKVEVGVRRPGDPSALVSDANRAKKILGWQPECDDINLICKTAFEWEKKLKSKLKEISSDFSA